MSRDGIEIASLTREFETGRGAKRQHRTALAGVDLLVPRGEVHGLLGPNGAGKTTLCKILATVLLPTSGRVCVDGHDVVTHTSAVRRSMGIVLGGERGLYTRLTARQNLRYWAAMYGLAGQRASRRTAELLERVGLLERADERVESFSRGMKQRLHLARGLIGSPTVLILDEPTAGMDPVAALEFRTLVGELRADGRTVLIATHDMREAEAVCDRVTLIANGEVVLTTDPRDVSGWIDRFQRVSTKRLDEDVARRASEMPGVTEISAERPDRTLFEVTDPNGHRALLNLLLDAGVTDLRTEEPSLEDVYIDIAGAQGWRV